MPNRVAGGHSAPAVAYVRVSTEEQAREGVSLDAQRARINAHCAAHSLELVGTYSDEGISGRRTSNRPGLEQAIRHVCSIRGTLTVYSLSRLARSLKDAILITERMEKCGAELVLLAEQIDTRSAAGRMFFHVMAALAQFESDLIGERTKLAIDFKRRAGKRYCCNAQFGYRIEDGRVVADAREQAALKTMQSLTRSGMSIRAVADRLPQLGILNRQGKPLSSQQVGVILRRARNASYERSTS